jgi:hypothetical protein
MPCPVCGHPHHRRPERERRDDETLLSGTKAPAVWASRGQGRSGAHSGSLGEPVAVGSVRGVHTR